MSVSDSVSQGQILGPVLLIGVNDLGGRQSSASILMTQNREVLKGYNGVSFEPSY